jgi:hypothetical protein
VIADVWDGMIRVAGDVDAAEMPADPGEGMGLASAPRESELRVVPSVAGLVPPQDLGAEAAVLSAILCDPTALPKVRDILEPEHFYSEANHLVYEACRSLSMAGTPVDIINVNAWLHDRQHIQRVGGVVYLAQLADATPAVANVATHARIVRDLAMTREGIATCWRAAARGYVSGASDRCAWISEAVADLRDLEARWGQLDGKDRWAWLSSGELAAPLGEAPWIVPGIQIGPGRPCSLQSYGGGAKTLSLAALVVSCVASVPVWGEFNVPRAVRARHIDLEMGRRASARRYQRIAFALGVELAGLPLELSALPGVRLTDVDIRDQLMRAAEGVELVAFDSLRAFLGSAVDENDSRARTYLDCMTEVSERTGVTWIGLHHVGKVREGHEDRRQKGRGSSALFDAWGTVLDVSREGDSLMRVTMTKVHPEGEGTIEPFGLEILDIPNGSNPKAGLLVHFRDLESAPATRAGQREATRQAERDVRRERRVCELVEELVGGVRKAEAPITSQAMLADLIRGARAERQQAVARALSAGRIVLSTNPRRYKVPS